MENKKAVICDDDVTLSRIIQFVLTKQGFSVFTAENGNDGLLVGKTLRPIHLPIHPLQREVDHRAPNRQSDRANIQGSHTLALVAPP